MLWLIIQCFVKLLKLSFLLEKLYSNFHYFKLIIIQDSCEAQKFQFLSSFCTDLWDTQYSKNISHVHVSSYFYGWEKIPRHIFFFFCLIINPISLFTQGSSLSLSITLFRINRHGWTYIIEIFLRVVIASYSLI